MAAGQHPAILATQYLVDAAGFSVKSAEGALLPQVTGSASALAQRADQRRASLTRVRRAPARTISISAASAPRLRCRSTRAGASLRRCVSPRNCSARHASRSTSPATRCVRRWLPPGRPTIRAKQGVEANRSAVAAAKLALEGIVEERNVGQRTTLDVLITQSDLITAEINLVHGRGPVGDGKLRHPAGDRSALCPPARPCRSPSTGRRSITMPSRTSGSA